MAEIKPFEHGDDDAPETKKFHSGFQTKALLIQNDTLSMIDLTQLKSLKNHVPQLSLSNIWKKIRMWKSKQN